MKVEAECSSCDGTGLYQGFCEAEGTAVVCIGCKGTGKMVLTLKPFTKRKGLRGVLWVHKSRGSFIATGVGPQESRVSYKEFQKGKMP
jgi:hypothetical protein